MKALIGIAVLAAIALAFLDQSRNPPGFHLDESSIAYNAARIASDGRDEHGERFPTYFRAFGEYKSPVYIYLLSAVFRVTGPSTLIARRFSAALGVLNAIALALLAWKVSRNLRVALATLLIVAVTPMLFEISRFVLEVALFPLAVALFLLAARTAFDRPRWSWPLILSLASTLALVTYTYSAGKLLGPLLALLLLLFTGRRNLRRLASVWIVYALLLIPLAAFAATHEGALLARARDVAPETTGAVPLALTVARNFALNLDPIHFALLGDPYPRNHVQGSGGSVLLMTFILVAAAVLTRRDRWTWFLLLGALASILPGAVTSDVHHSLRLSGYPIFLTALTVQALTEFERVRRLVQIAILLGALQASWFFFNFYRHGAERLAEFDAGARPAVLTALAQRERPIYVTRNHYIYAYWFEGPSDFQRLAIGDDPPAGAVVFSGDPKPRNSTLIRRYGEFSVYRTR